MGRVAAPVVALVLLTILPPAAAVAQVRDPAVDQYVESVPGAGGGTGTPNGGTGQDGAGLPPGVKRQIERSGGADAPALAAVASSPALGAPKQADSPKAGAKLRSGSESSPSALRSVASAAGGDGNSSGWLLAGLALLTAALAGTAFARTRLR
jgi:hypothetical protein